jgi:hypothetical protein
MERIKYYYLKIKSAWLSGTLLTKVSLFLITSIQTPFEIIFGYIRLPRVDRQLNLKDGFADHRKEKYHHRANPEHIRRIIFSYKAAKGAQEKAAKPFKIKGLWAEWISINYKKLISALENEDIDQLSCIFENIFREECTIGTGGYDDYRRYHTLLGGFYIKYVWCKYRDLLSSLGFNIEKIDFPHIGNQTGVIMNGKVIAHSTLRHAYHAVEMNNLFCDTPKSNIVEIGSGLGGQAHQALLMNKKISKYILFDIPEVAVISSYFLLSSFPNKKVRLFGEGLISANSSEEYDIGIFPHFSIDELSSLSVDLFYNSCSFSEMDRESSREYLSIIERVGRKYFMHDNHDAIFEFKNPDGSTSSNIIGSELIPDSELFQRVYKKPRVHGLPEDRSFVHYEYLYERIS